MVNLVGIKTGNTLLDNKIIKSVLNNANRLNGLTHLNTEAKSNAANINLKISPR